MNQPRRHIQSDIPSHCALPFWRGNVEAEDPVYCSYCGAWMDFYYDPGLWDVPFEDFAVVHEAAIRDPDFNGPPLGHPHVILRGDIVERKVCLHICPACGWWIAEERAVLPAMCWQHWAVTLASAPVLEELALDDISVPLQQVRRYLIRKFEARASMHPRLFELTVASVFGDLGYQAYATAYSNDGGVDVILEDGSGARIGVQVKRRRIGVEVEQIRAFLGALVLGGYSRGVYVSASRFSRGAREAARSSTRAVMRIELVDASRFFDMLGYAQLKHPSTPEDCNISRARPLTFHGHAVYHLNTL
jgi:restriction system protein